MHQQRRLPQVLSLEYKQQKKSQVNKTAILQVEPPATCYIDLVLKEKNSDWSRSLFSYKYKSGVSNKCYESNGIYHQILTYTRILSTSSMKMYAKGYENLYVDTRLHYIPLGDCTASSFDCSESTAWNLKIIK